MKKKTLGLVCLLCFVVSLCCLQDTVTAQTFSSKDDCLNRSGGLREIGSVDWACGVKMEKPGINVCAFWLGGADKRAEIQIDYNSIDGSIYDGNEELWETIYYWGMCTDAANTAVDIEIKDSNGEVDYIDSRGVAFSRGTWGNATGISKSKGLNVSKFISGLTPEKDGDTETYERKVNVKRCHSFPGTLINNGSCSSQDVTIRVVIKNIKPKYFAQSYVAIANIDGGEKYETTGLVSDFAEEDVTASVAVGDTVELRFSHNIYSSIEVSDDVNWSLGRTKNPNNGFMVDNKTEGPNGGTVKFDKREGIYWVPDRTMSDADKNNRYIARDVYGKVTFNRAGRFTFCENMVLAGKDLTKVCAVINVDSNLDDDDGDDDDGGNIVEDDACSEWKPTGFDKNGEDNNFKIYTVSGVVDGTLNPSKISDIGGWAKSNGNSQLWSQDNQGGSHSQFDPSVDGVVYAKPKDEIYWHHCYFSEVKAGRDKYDGKKNTVDSDEIVGENIECPYGYGSSENSLKKMVPNFENGFEIKSGNFDYSATIKKNSSFFDGDSFRNTGVIGWRSDVLKIPSRNNSVAGLSLTQSMISEGSRSVTISGHKCCTSWNDEGKCNGHAQYNVYNENDNEYKDTAMVKVPYNFTIDSVSLELEGNAGKVYAGESVGVASSNVHVGTRKNEVTGGTSYATRVKDADVQVITYVTDSPDGGSYIYDKTMEVNHETVHNLVGGKTDLCDGIFKDGDVWKNGVYECYYDGDTKALNDPEITTGKTEDVIDYSINVIDADAGKYFCAALAVYPVTTYGDTDVDVDSVAPWNGNREHYYWRISNPSCRLIAKKPSMQVWGGSLYANSDIVLSTANKKVLAGFEYELKSRNSGTTTFGSWVESGIMANGLINGLASGAATGYYNPNNGERTPHYNVGGTYSSNSNPSSKVCVLGPLTMPNHNCVNSTLSNFYPGGGGNESFKHGDRESLVSVFRNNGTSVSNKFNYEKIESSGDVSLKGFLNEKGIVSGTIPKSNEQNKAQTWILEVTGSDGKYKTLTIDEDVKYEDGGYTSLSEIPKLIIYAGNINILCGVTRVDAVLITAEGGKIDTCSDAEEGNWDVRERSKQLKINGTIITDKLIAGRTYGAGTGSASAVPAEIIDYDTSLYLWAMQNAKGSNSGKMDVVYLTELAPRY